MQEDQLQPNPMEETNQLLEQVLESADDNSKLTHNLLENLIEQSGKEDNLSPLLENNLEMQDKIVQKLDELKDQTWDIHLILE